MIMPMSAISLCTFSTSPAVPRGPSIKRLISSHSSGLFSVMRGLISSHSSGLFSVMRGLVSSYLFVVSVTRGCELLVFLLCSVLFQTPALSLSLSLSHTHTHTHVYACVRLSLCVLLRLSCCLQTRVSASVFVVCGVYTAECAPDFVGSVRGCACLCARMCG